MKKILKNFVTFYSPGLLVATTWTEDVCNVEPSKIKWPDTAYSFTMHERDDVIDGSTVYKGDVRQVGPRYWHPDSKVEAIEQARLNPNATRTFISNIERNHWDKIVWNRWSYPHPFSDEMDVVLT